MAGIFGEFLASLRFSRNKARKLFKKFGAKLGAKLGAKFGANIRRIRGTFDLTQVHNAGRGMDQGHPFPKISRGFWCLVSPVDFFVSFFPGSFSLEKP